MTIIIDLIKYNGHIPFDSTMQAFIYYFTQSIVLLFFLMYVHQMFFVVLGTLHHGKFKAKKPVTQHTIGIVISARNESRVIGNLIDSVYANDYPKELIKIFVVADNCTDNTAQIAREKGCIVFERSDTEKKGKGYALNYMFTKLHTEAAFADVVPEAYIVLDADNVIKPNYITEMNKVFDGGYKIITSYRNSTNFGRNWITAGYGYWFLHEARHLNNCRMMLHTSCAISGTGFLIARETVEAHGNWNFFTMTEDIQCSTEYSLKGGKVGYCSTAEFYDEQPTTFGQSWVQRERWAKGFYQVFGRYGGQLVKGFFRRFACWDIFTTIFPALFISLMMFIVLPVTAIVAASLGDTANAIYALRELGSSIVGAYCMLFIVTLLCGITEWKKICAPWWKKILYMFTFPVFMFTYLPISVGALFKKVEWKPIVHTADITIDDLTIASEEEENLTIEGAEEVRDLSEDNITAAGESFDVDEE